MYPRMRVIVGRVRAVSVTPLGLAYWETDSSVAGIAKQFAVPIHRVWREAGAGVLVEGRCRYCGGPLIVATREEARELIEGRRSMCVFCGSRTLQGLTEAMARW